jgi:8-oxo-dGTP pyrophosphatase MutT (NUDIX family)
MTGVAGLTGAIQAYLRRWPKENTTAACYLSLLGDKDAFLRTHRPGHITGSAFIVNQERTHTLLVHHAKLNRWLQPGGHADGETDITQVARREANEETGVMNLELIMPEIYDLDIHPIPPRKDFPAHDHYDIRYLFRASINDPITVSEESHDVRWIRLDDLMRFNDEPSLLRLRDKLPVSI